MNSLLHENDSRLTLSIAAVGLTSLVTQIILLREFLSVFYGNELVIGILLANWMIITGIGAYVGRYFRPGEPVALPVFLVLFAIIPYATLLGLRLLRNVVFPAGVMVGIVPILWSSFVLLIPFCILSGASFALMVGLRARSGEQGSVGSFYALESIGSVVGGLSFSLSLFRVLSSFQCLAVLMAADFALALFITRERLVASFVVWVTAAVFLLPAIMLNVDSATKGRLFPGQTIVFSKDTPYGSLVVTQQAEQENFYENNVLLASTNNAMDAEESVHYAIVQRDSIREVLMISGAITGAAQEVLKYNIRKLDYVEPNPSLLDLSVSNCTALSDKRVKTFGGDPRVFLRTGGPTYDAVLLNVPEPSTIQTNRYYTLEFFDALKNRMNSEGVLSLPLLSAAEYNSDEARRINSTMMQTLKAVFKNVLIVPGLKTYFLASDGALDIHIGELVKKRGVLTMYVNRFYLDEDEMIRRSGMLEKSLNVDVPLNKDFAPVSYYRHVAHWLSYFRDNLWIVGGVALLFLLFAGFQMNAVNSGIFAGGFAASSLEVLLLVAFQILYGYVYEMLGLIVTLFMAGLAVGSLGRSRVISHPKVGHYVGIQLAIALYCILLPFVLMLLRGFENSLVLVHGAVFLLAFFVAALVGMEFSIAAELRAGEQQRIASELYGIDLIGSALGALLVAVVFIPVLGFAAAGIVPGILILLTALIAVVRRKSIEAATQ
jgi:spermidine synthase